MYRTQPGLRAVNLRKARLLDRIAMQEPRLAQEIRSLKLNWFKVRNAVDSETEGDGSPDAGQAEVFIYDEIGGSFGVGVSDFIDALAEIDSPSIVVRINSPGGLLIDAIAIHNALNQHPAHITTRVDGIAASAASIVAIAGDRLEMMPGSQLMIHDVIVDFSGNRADMGDMMDWLDEQSNNVANMYATQAGGDVEEWRNLMLAETWMFAQEAVDSGLAQAVYERITPDNAFPPKKQDDEEPDGDEPEKPDEQEPDSGKNDDSGDDEEGDDEEASDSIESEALAVLMSRKHRLSNRGYKYLGRDRAPAPAIPAHNNLADLVDLWR